MKEFDAEIFMENLAAPFIRLAFLLVHACWPGYLTRKMQRMDNFEAAYLVRTLIKMPFVRSVEVDRDTKKVVMKYPSYIQDTKLIETIRKKTGLDIDLAKKPLKKITAPC